MKILIALFILAAFMFFILSSCSTIPKGAVAVRPFDTKRYLGAWYEIARLDFTFEKNLNNTTATYSLNDDGSIKVVNRGYDYVMQKKKEAVGKAKPAGLPDEARLKVSFFGPFYAPYNVIALDAEYQYALIAGKSVKYLWILSRQKSIPGDIREKYLDIANKIGVDTSKLIWVEQNNVQE